MSDLVERLRKRAIYDRAIQANNEVVAAALRGQRLLFDQDVRSASNTYAVRLCLDYERYAKNDAALAADWDSAADRIEQLERELDISRMAQVVMDNSVAEVERLTAQNMRLSGMCYDLNADIQASNELGKALEEDAGQLREENARLREALEQIEITCDEEIRARTAGMSEVALKKSRILPLLQIPRNMARAALGGNISSEAAE